MAFPTIPTAQEIKDRIVSDIENKLNQNVPAFSKSFVRALAGSIAGMILLLYFAITWVYRQIFPDTADEAALKLLGKLVGVNIRPATFAIHTANVPGTNGTIVPEGTQFKAPNGSVFSVTTSGTVSGGVAVVSITALVSGESGNLAPGTELAIVSPVTGLIGPAEIVTTTTSGDDQESLDSYRTRVSNAYKKRRTGGSPADYEAWGLEAPNFDWISPLDNETLPGDVSVYGKVDNQTDGIPTGSQLTELEGYLLSSDPNGTAIRDRHPIGPPVTAYPISRFSFDVTISIQGGTTEIKADIETAVTNYIEVEQRPYNEAIDQVKKDVISQGGISSAGNAIANPEGATVTAVLLEETVSGQVVPNNGYQLFGGTWGKVNSITFDDIT
jgi:uncharacterized phage protein gp47/JayE